MKGEAAEEEDSLYNISAFQYTVSSSKDTIELSIMPYIQYSNTVNLYIR